MAKLMEAKSDLLVKLLKLMDANISGFTVGNPQVLKQDQIHINTLQNGGGIENG